MNAINDALSQIGAPYVQMPATPEKVWRAMAAGRGSSPYTKKAVVRSINQ
jgi:hypothetical protein